MSESLLECSFDLQPLYTGDRCRTCFAKSDTIEAGTVEADLTMAVDYKRYWEGIYAISAEALDQRSKNVLTMCPTQGKTSLRHDHTLP